MQQKSLLQKRIQLRELQDKSTATLTLTDLHRCPWSQQIPSPRLGLGLYSLLSEQEVFFK